MPVGAGTRPQGVLRRGLKPMVFVLCALPLAWLLARTFGIAGTGPGPNPIDEIMDRLGGEITYLDGAEGGAFRVVLPGLRAMAAQ